MNQTSIKFTHGVGILAVIEGIVKKEAGCLEFEMTMTESISGPVKNVIRRKVIVSEIESIKVKRRIFRKSCLEFTASNLRAFKSLPGSKGFTFSVVVETSHKEAVSFVREVLFELTLLESETLRKRIACGSAHL